MILNSGPDMWQLIRMSSETKITEMEVKSKKLIAVKSR